MKIYRDLFDYKVRFYLPIPNFMKRILLSRIVNGCKRQIPINIRLIITDCFLSHKPYFYQIICIVWENSATIAGNNMGEAKN